MYYLDKLPSHEQEKIRKRLRSPEEYERLRECVKGPEDLERELSRSEMVAEARFQMESEPSIKEGVKAKVESDIKNGELVFENLEEGVLEELNQGKFELSVESHPETHQDQLAIRPSGTVSETIWLDQGVGDMYLGGIT